MNSSISDLLDPGERLVELGWGYGLPGGHDSRSGVWLFACPVDIDPQAALAAARDDWLARISREAAAGFDHSFGLIPNWGDFVADADTELRAHGLRTLPTGPTLALDSVHHDEVIAYL